ncbi:MAG TPA: hypothetical protein VHY20_04790, partial [Pirellulales bacterium]|nr:hypothetical protein [Pirellulales bacterium]
VPSRFFAVDRPSARVSILNFAVLLEASARPLDDAGEFSPRIVSGDSDDPLLYLKRLGFRDWVSFFTEHEYAGTDA